MNHIIVDMRFNQVIRAEPRAGECGLGVPEYQAGLGAGLGKWKSHLQLSWGPASRGRGRCPPPVPLCELLSCDQHVVCAAPRVPLRGLGQAAHKGPGDRGWTEAGIGPQVMPPWK